MASSLPQRNSPHPHRSSPPLRALDSAIDTKTHSPLHLVIQEGQLQVHTAPFRGSFTGVLSDSLRAAGLGRKVVIFQFLKGGVAQGPEGIVNLCDRLEWVRPAINCCINSQDQFNPSELNTLIKEAIEEIWVKCKRHLTEGDRDQLVLEEIGLAISLGYLSEEELISTLHKRPGSMDVILTGTSLPSSVIAMADQVTKLRCYS